MSLKAIFKGFKKILTNLYLFLFNALHQVALP